ncbi:MAG TPA: glycoside hydrolase family 57 protein [Bryobacteraceae bacterium]|nr:glycoside hydrolase family 57 protein [Bryobacteraceae bacterium]
MPHIYLCFLWHMHQPFYKDLASGEYKLPWTRLHALKDYYGMVAILREFPKVHQTFNLVPSMMVQVDEYARGEARDPYLDLALKPAETLSEAEQAFLRQQFLVLHPPPMTRALPRYADLRELGRRFTTQDYRDLQVISQLLWFDEDFRAADPAVQDLFARGRDYTLEDQRLVGEKQREILALVIPVYRELAGKGQIEVSTTPYYHPILPLLCDSNIAAVSHPGVPLPPPFRYPEDARRQLEMARDFVRNEFGVAPVGLWPSEGSVSDAVFALAADTGYHWAASDSGVLSRTLGRSIGVDAIYRAYHWQQSGAQLNVLFRDHFLSDLIGFVYSGMDAAQAAHDFLNRIRENCRGLLAGGRDALVPIILDGENAWEYYEQNGRPFLRHLYGLISEDPQMSALTVSEALARMEPEPLSHVFPGSWINANFDVWIGAEEDNQAWSQLLRARETYQSADHLPEDRRRLAYEELLIAEGSDWCWWYGPEHDSGNRIEFDQLYRSHLANVYRFLNFSPPEELSQPILRVTVSALHVDPTGPIRPVIDGEVTSYFEWLGAGLYRVDERSGSMHGKKFLVHEVHYGSDDANFYLRVDFHRGSEQAVSEMEARLTVAAGAPAQSSRVTVRFESGRARVTEMKMAAGAPDDRPAVEFAFRQVLEGRLSLRALGTSPDAPLRFQFSLWQGGLPMDAVPQQGWIEVPPAEQAFWAV